MLVGRGSHIRRRIVTTHRRRRHPRTGWRLLLFGSSADGAQAALLRAFNRWINGLFRTWIGAVMARQKGASELDRVMRRLMRGVVLHAFYRWMYQVIRQ